MTHRKTSAPRRCAAAGKATLAIVLGALLLAGCSSGHIGEDWQCPLAAGGSCASVAAADPAVPKTGIVQAPASGQPIRLLPRDVETERADTSAMEPRFCNADCGFDPFAWLARLFGGSDRSAPRSDGSPKSATANSAAATATPNSRAAESDAALPADATSDNDGLPTDDLRTGEVVARIWIAPFVDADGVYREASHVRVVVEPAGWRLP